jgi:hypothetical protein
MRSRQIVAEVLPGSMNRSSESFFSFILFMNAGLSSDPATMLASSLHNAIAFATPFVLPSYWEEISAQA